MIESTSSVSAVDTFAEAVAFCDSGDVATGGGGFLNAIDTLIPIISSVMGPHETGSIPDRWVVTWDNAAGATGLVSANVICADVVAPFR